MPVARDALYKKSQSKSTRSSKSQSAEHVCSFQGFESFEPWTPSVRGASRAQLWEDKQSYSQMSTAGAASRNTNGKQPDELDDKQAYERFGLSSYQLDKLPARRLSMRDSRRYGSCDRVCFYKVSCVHQLVKSCVGCGLAAARCSINGSAHADEWLLCRSRTCRRSLSR